MTASDLREWLQRAGLEALADPFEANGIDLDILPELTGDELGALGLTLGDRKRLARALARDGKRPADSAPAAASAAASQPGAERRWMTVMFCDLAGSTPLSERMDPEPLHQLIALFEDKVAGAVIRFGGYVANFQGDAVVAYFGWPRASEDQAECAVRAAIATLEAVADLTDADGCPLHARIGISTGQVVIGDIFGASKSLAEAVVIGRTPNVAARLQSVAEVDRILIDDATRQEIGRRFRLEPQPSLTLKGLSTPVTAWRVVGARPIESRFDARATSRGVLVGRGAEFELLADRWRRARAGDGQVLLLTGDAGVGKSRLIETLLQEAGPEPFYRFRYQCSSLQADTPLYPVIRQFQRSLRFEAGDSDQDRLAKLIANLEPLIGEDPQTITLSAQLMSLPTKGLAPLPDEPPPLRRERLIAAMTQLLLRLAERRPVILVFEDAQWSDPSTSQLMLRTLGAIPGHRILLIATQRQPFGEKWSSAGHVTALDLDRLEETESAALVRSIAGAALDEPLIERIVAKADGVPLFLEEMTRAVVERRAAGDGDTDGGIPPTLQASLTSRLDHLGPAKALAQIGAVIGRQVPLDLLAAVAERSPASLSADIDRLLSSELLSMAPLAAEPTLFFKHVLVQEAAYEGLLHAERRRLHAVVLQSIEKLRPGQIDALTETLATHAERAEDWPRAANYLARGCSRAVARFANREAISLYERADRALAHLPLEASAAAAIDLRLHAASAFQAVGDNEKLVEIIGEAATLAAKIGDRRRLGAALAHSAFALWMAGKHGEALARGEAALAIAEELNDLTLRIGARFQLANIHHARGELEQAVALHREVIAMMPGELAAKRLGWSGSPALFSRAFLAWYLCELGAFAEARQVLDEALGILAAHEQPFSRVLIQTGVGIYHSRRGEFEAAIPPLEEALELSRTAEVLTMYPMIAALLGSALLGAGRSAAARPIVIDAVERETYRFGGKYTWIHLHLALAEVKASEGDREGAHLELAHALEIAQSCGEVLHHAYGLKLGGDLLLAEGRAGEARALYEQAMAVAGPRGARPLLAHAELGMARCAGALGELAEAARWYGRASAEFDGLDLPYWSRRAAAEIGAFAAPG